VLRRGTRAPLCMLHRNPPLCVKTGLRADRVQHWVLLGRSAVSRLLFRPCFLAKRLGRLRPGGRPPRDGPPSRPPGCVRGDVAFWQPWLVGPKTRGASGLSATVGDHYGEIGDGDSTHCRNRRQPPRAPDEQGNRGRKTSDPDSHHDQVAALPRGNVRRQSRLCLRNEVRAVTARPSGGFHPPNVRPPGVAGECGIGGVARGVSQTPSSHDPRWRGREARPARRHPPAS
jgi:hypothetical protein